MKRGTRVAKKGRQGGRPFERRYSEMAKENRRLAQGCRDQVESARQTFEKERQAAEAERELLYSMQSGLSRLVEAARRGFWSRLWFALAWAWRGRI